MSIHSLYYSIKPFIPRRVQLVLRRRLTALTWTKYADNWPIELKAATSIVKECNWDGGKPFALVLTHDVDTAQGQERCLELASLEKNLNFRSSFNFVPERYGVDHDLRSRLASMGFEIGVHGLNHDGRLYSSETEFNRRAETINKYIEAWGAVGFRSPAMHHNLEWIKALHIEYDASTFDTDPFEPQPDGVGTIFPFWVARDDGTGYVELPYTLPQDFTLFVLLKEKTIDIWKKKLDWIAEKGGMALLNTHPDYMYFGEGKPGFEEYPAAYYREFLKYVKEKYEGQYWHVLPKEMARFWKETMVP
jgi:hypothetical protein